MARPSETADQPAVVSPCLAYCGDGAYVVGVPTDTLHLVEAQEAERLIETGLYQRTACACEASGTNEG